MKAKITKRTKKSRANIKSRMLNKIKGKRKYNKEEVIKMRRSNKRWKPRDKNNTIRKNGG